MRIRRPPSKRLALSRAARHLMLNSPCWAHNVNPDLRDVAQIFRQRQDDCTSKNRTGSGWMISVPFVSKNTPICCWTGSVIALKARMSLLTMRQILRAQDGTQSLETFLRAVPEGTPILITGHSLGGCLASVLAPCVADWRGSTSSGYGLSRSVACPRGHLTPRRLSLGSRRRAWMTPLQTSTSSVPAVNTRSAPVVVPYSRASG